MPDCDGAGQEHASLWRAGPLVLTVGDEEIEHLVRVARTRVVDDDGVQLRSDAGGIESGVHAPSPAAESVKNSSKAPLAGGANDVSNGFGLPIGRAGGRVPLRLRSFRAGARWGVSPPSRVFER